MNFYFTYGTDPQFPFKNGWTLVVADNARRAAAAFREYHPDENDGVLNCAFVYDQEGMEKTGMLTEGNGGEFCHECIALASSAREEDFTETPSKAENARLALKEYDARERKRPARCPRCGKKFKAGECGALSRRLPVTICDACGADEALEDYSAVHGLPRKLLEEWDFVKYFKNVIEKGASGRRI